MPAAPTRAGDRAWKVTALAMAALLEKGEWPEASKMRTEEFVNAFDYGDPSPTLDEKVACRTEQCAHPFLQETPSGLPLLYLKLMFNPRNCNIS